MFHHISKTPQKCWPLVTQKVRQEGCCLPESTLRNHSHPSLEYKFSTSPNVTACSQKLLDAYSSKNTQLNNNNKDEPDDEGNECEAQNDVPPTVSLIPSRKYCSILQSVLWGWWAAIFTQLLGPYGSGHFYSVIMYYLVLAGLKPNGKGKWGTSGDISQDIAVLLFIGQLMMFLIIDKELEVSNKYNYQK